MGIPAHIKASTLLAVVCTLCGCGTFVPEIEEFWGSPGDVSIKVNAIASQVKCELRESVRSLLADDARLARENGGQSQLEWLKTWVAQATLTFTTVESTALNPGVTLNSPLNNAATIYGPTTVTTPQSYAFGFGAGLSSTATRTDAVTAIYPLSEFVGHPPKDISCIPSHQTNGMLFIQSDLKLKQWLYQSIFPQYTDVIRFPLYVNSNVKNGFVSHDIKFQIVSSGNATPTWKLVRVSANTGNSPFFNMTRDRTQDLLITLGPSQEKPKPGQAPALSTAAQNSHLASQIGNAVAAAIKAAQ